MLNKIKGRIKRIRTINLFINQKILDETMMASILINLYKIKNYLLMVK